MGYYIQALIGNEVMLKAHISDFIEIHVIPLTQGIAMIPLTDDLFDEIGEGSGHYECDGPNEQRPWGRMEGQIDNFEKLSPSGGRMG